ncbi:hypothetical protein CDAR_588231 [Caerostris darwini]|uniref:Uncharacterized protein n=1 Tax=Caerostris darwini TaxID=1538125 RepID=A0AAV4S6B8_9ARAC|nr:hypothetical protein CDAR_588231 [Caerostris darwini]
MEETATFQTLLQWPGEVFLNYKWTARLLLNFLQRKEAVKIAKWRPPNGMWFPIFPHNTFCLGFLFYNFCIPALSLSFTYLKFFLFLLPFSPPQINGFPWGKADVEFIFTPSSNQSEKLKDAFSPRL